MIEQESINELFSVCNEGNVQKVRGLIAQGADINEKDDAGETAIMKLGMHGAHEELVELLLSNGADINDITKEGNTALSIACKYISVRWTPKEYLDLLIKHGANPEIRDENGATVLMVALNDYNLTVDVLESLIAHGADVNAKDNQGNTPLMIALSAHYLQIVDTVPSHKKSIIETLIKHGADINAKNYTAQTPLIIALQVYEQEEAIIEFLVSRGADINAKDIEGRTARDYADENGYKKKIIKLLTEGHLTNAKNKISKKELNLKLFEAIKNRNLQEVKAAIDNGADVNTRIKGYETPLYQGIKQKDIHYEILDYLIAQGADVNAEILGYKTLLIEAAAPLDYERAGRFELVQYLIDKGADVNRTGKYSTTPMKDAIYNNGFKTDTRTVEYLWQKGADINAVDSNGDTMLEYAIYRDDRFNAAIYLIDHGIDINRKNNFGETVLMKACDKGNEQMVQLLLNHGVKLDERDSNGQTALMIACKSHENIGILLIRNGADVNVKDNSGNTPLSISYSNKNFELVKTLLEAGAIDPDGKITPAEVQQKTENVPETAKLFIAAQKKLGFTNFPDEYRQFIESGDFEKYSGCYYSYRDYAYPINFNNIEDFKTMKSGGHWPFDNPLLLDRKLAYLRPIAQLELSADLEWVVLMIDDDKKGHCPVYIADIADGEVLKTKVSVSIKEFLGLLAKKEK